MSIFYDNTSGLITLQTKHTSYQMKVDPYRHLQHLYYGAFIGTQDMSYLHRHYDRGFSGNPYVARDDRTYSLDTISQEYTSFGVGDYRVPSFIATLENGTRCTEFLFEGLQILPGKYDLAGLPASYDFGLWPRLRDARPEQRAQFELTYSGIHWPASTPPAS